MHTLSGVSSHFTASVSSIVITDLWSQSEEEVSCLVFVFFTSAFSVLLTMLNNIILEYILPLGYQSSTRFIKYPQFQFHRIWCQLCVVLTCGLHGLVWFSSFPELQLCPSSYCTFRGCLTFFNHFRFPQWFKRANIPGKEWEFLYICVYFKKRTSHKHKIWIAFYFGEV